MSSKQQPAIYYINRDQDAGRRAVMERQLENLALSAVRVRAVNGMFVPDGLAEQFFTAGRLHSELKPGEVGCYASHLLAMRAFLASGQDYAVILEDDAIIDATLVPTIEKVVRNAPAGWGLINLCREPDRASRTVAELGDGRRILRCSRLPPGMVGYLVSRLGAERITAPCKRHFPSDVELRTPWKFNVDVYCLSHALITYDRTAPSIIGELGGQSKLRRGMPRIRAYCWTGNPIRSPQGAVYNIGKLGFINWLSCTTENTLRLAAGRLARRRRAGVQVPGIAKPYSLPVARDHNEFVRDARQGGGERNGIPAVVGVVVEEALTPQLGLSRHQGTPVVGGAGHTQAGL